jgi:hypothetical protein
MPRPSHPPWLHHSNYTWKRIQVMKLFIMQFSPTSCRFISLHSNILSSLFSNSLNLCSSLNVKDQVSHPYRTTGKIIVLYISIFKFFSEGDSELSSQFHSGAVFEKSVPKSVRRMRAALCGPSYLCRASVHNSHSRPPVGVYACCQM